MHLKIAVVLIVLVCLTALVESRRRSCDRKSFKRLHRCKKCCNEDCHSCQQNSHNNRYKCKLVRCDIVSAPFNGMVFASGNNKYGSSLHYTCNPGYQLCGPDMRICNCNGDWDGHTPECKAICPLLCSPLHGNINTTLGNLAGSKVTYTCDHDYRLVGPEERICLADGTWEYADPHCEPVVKCPIPSEISDGEISYSGLYEDDYVSYQCDYDFGRIGPEVRTCEAGSWTQHEPRCVPVVKCPFQCAPGNGYVEFDTSNTRLGDMAWYFCDHDFIRNGPEYRICEGNGTWSGPEPTCTPVVRCPHLCDPHNGLAIFDDTRVVGTMASFECFPEFELSDTEYRVCDDNGNWSSPSPVCSPVVRCSPLCNPSNGHVNQSDNLVGSVAMYECDPEFVLSGSESSVCQSDGTWSELEPVCEPVVRCAPLCNPSNGYVNQSDNNVGSVAMYECDPEYVLRGSEYSICQSIGTWSDPEPVCEPVVRCPDLCDPNNGHVDHYDTLVGSVAMYSCDQGFVLKGVENRVCLPDGTWNNTEPVCEQEVTCPRLCPPSDGYVHNPDLKVGALAYYGCDSGFTGQGSWMRVCAENGSWVPIEPTCQPIKKCGNRWYMAFENDKEGAVMFGNLIDLRNAVDKGAEFRVRFPSFDIVAPLESFFIFHPHICGQITFQMKKNGYDRFQGSAAWKFQEVCTNGFISERQYKYGEYVLQHSSRTTIHTQWFIRERCDNKPILRVKYKGQKGVATSGSVYSVINALKNGQSIQMSNNKRSSGSVDHIEYSNMEDEFVAVNIWEVNLNSGLWRFSLSSSNIKVQVQYWKIGVHEKKYEFPARAYTIDWFTDPCWNIVFKNNENGTALTGYDIADLRDKALNGHKIRVTYNRQQMECSEVWLIDDHVCCSCFDKISKSAIDVLSDDIYHMAEMVCTNGKLSRLTTEIGSNIVVNGTIEENATVAWSVDVRQWEKVASIDNDGNVTSGSKQVLRHAIENGAEVRYKIYFGDYTVRIVEPDQIEFDGDELAAMHIRSLSTLPDDDNVLQYFQERPFLMPTIMATNGKMNVFRWTLGEHELLGHDSVEFRTEWFTNL